MFLALENLEGVLCTGFHSQASTEFGHPVKNPELNLAQQTDVSSEVSDFHDQ